MRVNLAWAKALKRQGPQYEVILTYDDLLVAPPAYLSNSSVSGNSAATNYTRNARWEGTTRETLLNKVCVDKTQNPSARVV
jgi:hypothetical protein